MMDALREDLDARAVRTHRAYYAGEDAGFEGDWVNTLFPQGLPVWADLVLVTTIAGHHMCRMQCIRCNATGSPVNPEDHEPGCDYSSYAPGQDR